jgi:[acyl-carrier-protein] S-malonyltransferase
MVPIAIIFPGQGSQYPGMGKDLFDNFPSARQVFETADQSLGFPLSQMCFSGPEGDLKLTENTQPAILTVSVAAYAVLAERGIEPAYVAGHSLGEYSALVAAGALSIADAVQLVRKRGRYMQEAVPVGQGGMAAILGMPEEKVVQVCLDAAQGAVLSVANLNYPAQTVIAGDAAAVNRAIQMAGERGAKKVVSLPVSAPFHCALMKPAQLRLQQDIAAISFANLRFPLVNNADASELTESASVADSLVRQVCSPVRWTESMRSIIRQGVGLFVEVGPGRVLSGLLRQIDRNVKLANVEDEKSLNATMSLLLQTT